MASELKMSGLASASTYYAVIRNAAGSYWNGSAFAAYNAANWTTYAVSAAAPNSAGDWTGDFPVVAAGLYSVQIRQRAGASAAITDAVMGSEDFVWDGSAEVRLPTAAENAAAVLADPSIKLATATGGKVTTTNPYIRQS